MRFQIFDVEHGFCAYAVADNGNLMVFDCGHNSSENFRPSDYFRNLGYRRIDRFFVTNYDEDHISDLPQLRANLYISILHRNKTISPDQLRALKRRSGPISPAMQELLDMMSNYTGGISNPPDFPRISWRSFQNSYVIDFDDTNNISLVTFLDLDRHRFLIPGDLEKAGWNKLLLNDEFRNILME